jgi:hypothetical protein
MSINAPIASIINTGHAIAIMPAKAQTIIAKAAKINIIKHKVIIVVPP